MNMMTLVKKTATRITCIFILSLFVLLSTSCESDNSIDPSADSTAENASESDSLDNGNIEKFVLSPDNDYSVMHSRDEREFSVLAYPKGITEDDFTIESVWNEYVNITNINLSNTEDATNISFNVSIDSSLLSHSSDATERITLKATKGNAESEAIRFPLIGVEISDAEPLTLTVNEPQIASFKVIPASFPLEELKIGMNAYVGNLKAEIINSEIDEKNNCQYVHVKITANGRHNGMSTGYVNLNDMYQLRGGTCDLTIIE